MRIFNSSGTCQTDIIRLAKMLLYSLQLEYIKYCSKLLSNPSPKPCPPRPNPNPKPKEVKNPKSNWDWGDTKIP